MTKVTIKNKEGTVLKTLDLDPTQKILKQLEAAGVEIPNACLMGVCSACMCNIESGAEHVIKDFKGEPSFPLGDDEVMTCIGGVSDTDQEIILKTIY